MNLSLEAIKQIDYGQVTGFLRKWWLQLLCGLLVVAAPVTAWLLLPALHQPVADEVAKRRQLHEGLAALERASVTVRRADGTSSEQTLPQGLNRAIIERLAAYNRSLGERSEASYLAAVRRNRGGHALAPGLEAFLPEPVDPNARKVNLLRESALPLLEAARDRMLQASRSGPAPVPAAVLEQVQRAEVEYLSGTLRKRSRGEVTDPDELRQLDGQLVDARKEFITQHALGLDFYMDPWALRWPQLAAGREANAEPSVSEALDTLFEYQWRIWIVEDVLAAIASTQAAGSGSGARGPMTSPIKRVISLQVQPMAGVGGGEGDPGTPTDPGMTGGMADGSGGGGGPTGQPIDPKAAIAPEPASSLTGLVSNQLFDVRTVTLRLVIDTVMLPVFVDQLARCNFIAVTNVSMRPADSFAAAREGYVYGTRPCSDVTLTLQSVWFRDWVTERMPASLRMALNTAGPAPSPESGQDTPEASDPGNAEPSP